MPSGDRIRYFRMRAVLDVDELAARAGVSSATVRNIESARTRPERSTTAGLADALGVPKKLLFGGADTNDWNLEESGTLPGGDWSPAGHAGFEILFNAYSRLDEVSKRRLVDDAVYMLIEEQRLLQSVEPQ
jgi:transcriptional regulator with XRE-family HTH domain